MSGCRPSYDYSGYWVGERKENLRPETDPIVVKTLNRVQLLVRPNRTFLLLDGGRPREGILILCGTHAKLEVEKYMGQPTSRQSEESKANNNGLLLHPEADAVYLNDGSGSQVKLIRAEQPPGLR